MGSFPLKRTFFLPSFIQPHFENFPLRVDGWNFARPSLTRMVNYSCKIFPYVLPVSHSTTVRRTSVTDGRTDWWRTTTVANGRRTFKLNGGPENDWQTAKSLIPLDGQNGSAMLLLLLLVLPHFWRLKTNDDDTKDLHAVRSLAIVLIHSGIDKPVQSFTSFDQRRFGLPRNLIPLMRPCNISLERFSALTTWPKYFNLQC